MTNLIAIRPWLLVPLAFLLLIPVASSATVTEVFSGSPSALFVDAGA